MAATLDEVLKELRALRADVAALNEKIAAPTLRGVTLLARHLGALPAAGQQAAPRVASDAELDGKYGDPKIICDPRDWNGPGYRGGRMSEAPAEFLELLAVVLDGFADDETDQKKQKYKREDAAKARGWARRARARASEAPPMEDV